MYENIIIFAPKTTYAMKRSVLFFIAAIMLMPAMFAQTKNNVARECVLFELFTGVRCPYCPAAANAVAQMLDEGLAVAPVGYHTTAFSTPDYYTTETNARASYYSISSYPTLKADGIMGMSGGGSASENMYSYYINYYNQRINATSPFTIELSFEPVEGTTCQVHCTVTQVGECSGNDVRVFIALTQCNINVSWQGMQGLHHVCRDMIPTQAGIPFTGPTMTIDQNFEMNWPKEDCYLTAWVQNYSGNKEVYQAVRMSTVMDLDYDIVLQKVENVLEKSCSGVQKPKFTVRNFGTQTVTSFDMCAFDGVEDHRQTWTGSMVPGASVAVEMEEFVAAPCDVLQCSAVMPNGQVDGFMADNYKSFTMADVPEIDGYVFMNLKTDSKPEETKVQVWDMVTDELVQEYTFTQAHHAYNEEFVLMKAHCYRIKLLDAGGDGLGSGSLVGFMDAAGNVLFMSGANYPFEYETAFELSCDGTLSVPETSSQAVIRPNPNNGTFSFFPGEGLWEVEVYDITGRMVCRDKFFASGMVSLKEFGSGVYFLKASNGEQEIQEKVMVY